MKFVIDLRPVDGLLWVWLPPPIRLTVENLQHVVEDRGCNGHTRLNEQFDL